jgi:hypothetical protein
MPWSLPPQPALATDRFILILAALWDWVWQKPGKEMTDVLSEAIRRKLAKAKARFAILAQRFHDGTLAPPEPRARPRKPAPSPDDAAPRTRPPPILPRHFAWLCGLVPQWAAGCGSQMQHLLQTPELEAMAKASPEVGKLLRPLLWMTGRMPPAYLALPPRTRRARAGLPPGPRRPRAAPVAPAESPPPAPPPPPALPPAPSAALLVTPVLDPDNWSHYSMFPRMPSKTR